jgi:hypothetical protein
MRGYLPIALIGSGLLAAGAQGSYPQGTKAQQTHPHVSPRTGKRHTTFRLRFTVADAAGITGVSQTEYRIEVRAPKGARAACTPVAPAIVTEAAPGTVEHRTLPEPAGGWCVGRYHVTVLLQRGPHCQQPDTMCPEFATQDLDVGRTRFRVQPKKTAAVSKNAGSSSLG